MKDILSALAEFDNTVKGERSQASMEALVKQGYWVHKAPLGYINARDVSHRPILDEDAKNGPLVRQLFERVAATGLTKSGAAEYASDLGLKQRNGKPITKQYLNKLLHNPLYCGRICCSQTNGQVVPAAFPRLIPEALFDQVQRTLKGHGKVPTPHHRNNEVFPLRRLVSCGHCEKPLTASFSRSKNGSQYPYYFCQQKRCRKVSVRKEVLEAGFVKQLEDLTLLTNSTMRMFREIVTQTWNHLQGDSVIEQARLTDQIERLEGRKSVLLEKLLDSTINDAIYRQKQLEIDAEISLMRAQKLDAEVDEVEIGSVVDRAEHLLMNAAKIWGALEGDLDNRQRLVRVLYPDGLSFTKEEGYRTPVNSPVAMICEVVSGQEKKMAPHQVDGWETLCAWLRVLDGFRAALVR
jgi:site-specific DNA recombinase